MQMVRSLYHTDNERLKQVAVQGITAKEIEGFLGGKEFPVFGSEVENG